VCIFSVPIEIKSLLKALFLSNYGTYLWKWPLNMTNDKLNKIDGNLSKSSTDLKNVIDQKVNVKENNKLKRKVLVLEKQHEESEHKVQIEQISKEAYIKCF